MAYGGKKEGKRWMVQKSFSPGEENAVRPKIAVLVRINSNRRGYSGCHTGMSNSLPGQQ